MWMGSPVWARPTLPVSTSTASARVRIFVIHRSFLDRVGRVELGGQIARTAVGNQRDHRALGAERAGHPDGGGDVGAGGEAAEDAFLAGETARHGDRVLVAHGDDVVDQLAAEDLRHEAFPDALLP